MPLLDRSRQSGNGSTEGSNYADPLKAFRLAKTEDDLHSPEPQLGNPEEALSSILEPVKGFSFLKITKSRHRALQAEEGINKSCAVDSAQLGNCIVET